MLMSKVKFKIWLISKTGHHSSQELVDSRLLGDSQQTVWDGKTMNGEENGQDGRLERQTESIDALSLWWNKNVIEIKIINKISF